MTTIRVDDAVRPTDRPCWGVYRVREITGDRVLVETCPDSLTRWVRMDQVEYLHTPRRWA